MTVAVRQNSISQVQAQGIQVLTREGSSTINATIRDNNVAVSGAGALDSIRVDSGATAADTTKVCADIRGNTSILSPGCSGSRARQRLA